MAAAATRPSEIVDGVVRWLTSATTLATVPTIAAWLPSVEPSRPRMPAVYVHLLGIPDARAAFNGQGGVRDRTYRVAVDVWWSITNPDPTGDQADVADLTEDVLTRLASDPTWGGLVLRSGGQVTVGPLDDTYTDLLAGRGILTWRIAVDADRYPIATT